MSSSHEHEFSPRRVLNKPTVAGPGNGNEVFFPQLGQPIKRRGETAVPSPTGSPTASPTVTEAPSKTPTATSTETPPPSETPTRKEVLWIKNDVRAYEATMPADPYSPSRRLGTLTGTADTDQVRIEVNPDDKDSGWILTDKGTPVAYRFVYEPYGTQAGKGPASPLQEPVILEIRIEDLQAHGLLDRLPDPQEHVYGGPRIIRKIIAEGAGLNVKTLARASQHQHQGSPLEQFSPDLAALVVGANALREGDTMQMTRRRFVLGGLAGVAALLAPKLLGGHTEEVQARPNDTIEPSGEIIYNDRFEIVPLIDPAFEVPTDGDVTVHTVIQCNNPEFASALINREPSLTIAPTGIIFARHADGAFSVEVVTQAANQRFRLNIPDYKPIEDGAVEFDFRLTSGKKEIVLTIYDQQGKHSFSFPFADGFDAEALVSHTNTLDPRNTAIYTEALFMASPQRLIDVHGPEPTPRLVEVDILNHRQQALKTSSQKDLWTNALSISGLRGPDARSYVADWRRSGAEIDGIRHLFFDPYRDTPGEREAAIFMNNDIYPVSPYGFKEIDSCLSKSDGLLLRAVDLTSIPGEARGRQVAEYISALQDKRNSESRIKLALKGFFDSSGRLSREIRKLGNESQLASELAKTCPAGTTFDHVVILGNEIHLTPELIKQLTLTIGSLKKGGLPLNTILASNIPPEGTTISEHVEGRRQLAQALKELDVAVGAIDVQGGGIGLSDEVELNAPERSPSQLPTPMIIAPAPRNTATIADQPYTYTLAGGLTLIEKNYAKLLDAN